MSSPEIVSFRKSIGKRLKAQRIKKGLSQEELAELIHISDRQYRRYEAGTASISFDVGNALVEALDLDFDYFVTGKHSIDHYLEQGLEKMPDDLYRKYRDILLSERNETPEINIEAIWEALNAIYQYGVEHPEDPPIRSFGRELTAFTEIYEE